MDLFDAANSEAMHRPLADRMRPSTLSEIVGQKHLTAKDTLVYKAIQEDQVFSMILWGPPGCGKTTLAGIIANETQSSFRQISAVLSGVKDIREVIHHAQERRRLYRQQTILFVDEIHRFNKAQQDAFLHHVENGLITLIGATTENPSFEVIPALVSRCRVFALKRLESGNIIQILKQALTDKDRGLGRAADTLSEKAFEHLAQVADGDARVALTNLETAVRHFPEGKTIDVEQIETAVEKKSLLYDKAGEEHYNLISAFIKSMRGSDPDAAVYWLERMLVSGEDPAYTLRRMVRFATEDIGLADPGALTMALNASDSFRMLGRPEGDEVLFQVAIYLATAPKSNAVYLARKAVRAKVKETGYLPVPMHIRNAPTKLMKQMGYGKGYEYAHDYKDAASRQQHLPQSIAAETFYTPTQRGYEKIVKQRLDAWRKIRRGKTDAD